MNYSEEKGLISIVIPVYNAELYLEPLIESIFNQTYKNFEVIAAYETASTDKTREVLEKLAKKYPIIISTGSERCPGGTRNRGFKLSRGEFVVFVDADDMLLPDYLASFISVFEKYPQIDITWCNYYHIPKEIINNAGNDCRKILSDYISYANFDNKISNIELLDSRTMLKRLMTNRESPQPWLYMIREDF